MRKLAGLVVLVSVLVAQHGRSGGNDAAQETLAKAIKALGGEENVRKHQVATWNEKGTYYGMGEGLPYMGKYAIQFPDKFRMEIEGVFLLVLNGDKGWMKMGDDTREMSDKEVALQIHNHRAGWMTSLLPLKDKAFTLTAAGEAEVDKKPTIVLKASRKDYPDVKLYIDKKTHLVVKNEFKTKFPEQGFKDVTAEQYFLDYRDVEGMLVPRKVVIKYDGKSFVEAENTDYKHVKTLDPKTFAKP